MRVEDVLPSETRYVRLHPERLVSPGDGPILSSQPSLKLDPGAHLHLDLLSKHLSNFLVIFAFGETPMR